MPSLAATWNPNPVYKLIVSQLKENDAKFIPVFVTSQKTTFFIVTAVKTSHFA
jgi:hypothetical protein